MKVSYNLEDVKTLFSKQSKPWWIAGGWAIDLFLGETTREHEDIDVSILRDDEKHFRTYLSDWEQWPGMGNDGLEDQPLPPTQPLADDREVLWCRQSAQSPWAFELLTSRTDGKEWLFKRDESIRFPLSEIGSVSADGMPYLKPEIILLFKAKELRPKDQQDFDACRTRLDEDAIIWLKNALEKVHPEHKWIDYL